MNIDNNVLTIKTVKINPIKNLMTGLSSIINETNLVFNKNGIHILTNDLTKVITLKLFLPSDKFEIYNSKIDKIIVGINLPKLQTLLSIAQNKDVLHIYIENSDYENGIVNYLTFKFDNAKSNSSVIHKIKLIDVDVEEIMYSDFNYPFFISMPSDEFSKIIKHFKKFSSKIIDVLLVGNEIIFTNVNSDDKISFHRNETSLEPVNNEDASKIKHGIFELKHLEKIVKCTNLCQIVDLYIDNKLPLGIKYNVADLGCLFCCIKPFVEHI
jgi:proliferating cell nuclear antigen PCNA